MTNFATLNLNLLFNQSESIDQPSLFRLVHVTLGQSDAFLKYQYPKTKTQ